ncbi:hypothetical protein M422DRAFT_243026 [Sphaerobolus stellatus SS14]|nr:hypothetical protein M422DRAFT_243026 [Sphaerobolus stellatus SS14]
MVKIATLLLFTLVRLTAAFPAYESFVGVNEREISEFIARNGVANISNPPRPLAKGQDGLNFEYSRVSRKTVLSGLLVTATMEGLNLGNDFAKFLVYQASLMKGNLITNLISIGLKSPLTGPDPPKLAQGWWSYPTRHVRRYISSYYIRFASHDTSKPCSMGLSSNGCRILEKKIESVFIKYLIRGCHTVPAFEKLGKTYYLDDLVDEKAFL